MQIFDRKYRLFGIINLIDLLVVIAVLVAVFAVYRVLSHGKATSAASGNQDITFTLLCAGTRGVTAQQVKVGDTIYKATTGAPIGTVKAVRQSPTPGEAWDVQTNSIKPYESTIYSDLWIDAVAKGTTTGTGFAIGSLMLHGGQPIPITTSTYECDSAQITTMTAVGQ